VTFPPGFFDRSDATTDRIFYSVPRLVTHIDDAAIGGVGDLYEELGVHDGDVLDLMSSWVSHLRHPPTSLTVLGMNAEELTANPLATATVVRDLNSEPGLPFPDATFDSVLCCVSVDYLVRPLEVFQEVHRVLVLGGRFICTFSNRLFPTKAIRGWLYASDPERMAIVEEYFRSSARWGEVHSGVRIPPGGPGDPLYAVWGVRSQPGPVRLVKGSAGS
jgi:SAM-dependent methyltransferase